MVEIHHVKTEIQNLYLRSLTGTDTPRPMKRNTDGDDGDDDDDDDGNQSESGSEKPISLPLGMFSNKLSQWVES